MATDINETLSNLGSGVGNFLDALVNPLATLLIVIAVAGFIGGLLMLFKDKI